MQTKPTNLWSAKAERSGDGALDSFLGRQIQSGVALRLRPHYIKNFSLISTILFILVLGSDAKAQTETPKFELGVHFSALPLDDDPTNNSFCDACETFTYTGIGGRFTYNLNDSLALESEVNFFL